MKEKELFENCIRALTAKLPVLRKMTGMTQKDLADILGISRQTITNIESGSAKMKWSLFLAIMFIFSINKDSSVYLKTIDIPYAELKIWFSQRCNLMDIINRKEGPDDDN